MRSLQNTLDREQTVCVCSGGICLKVPDWQVRRSSFLFCFSDDATAVLWKRVLFGETLNQWKFSDDVKCTCLRILRRTHMPLTVNGCAFFDVKLHNIADVRWNWQPECWAGYPFKADFSAFTYTWVEVFCSAEICFLCTQFSWLMVFLDYTALCNKDS